MKNTARIGLWLVILVLVGCVATATTTDWTPLPDPKSISAVKIVPPGPDIPPNIAIYSGIWEGKYDDNGRAVTVVIEEIKPSGEVIAIYSWGELPQYDSPSGWMRVRGRIIKQDNSNLIELSWSKRVVTLNADNTKLAYITYMRDSILKGTLYKKSD